MGTASLHLDSLNLAWRDLWSKLAPPCQRRDCSRSASWWRRLRRRPRMVLLQGSRYCTDDCMERAMLELLQGLHPAGKPAALHRLPLGLLLLSRQQLTAEQLRLALEAQRRAGSGRIGEWLQTLGFATEQQVTAALARQWSCPVLRTTRLSPNLTQLPQIPYTLLKTFLMLPLEYVASTTTLHIAVGESIDYSMLYAVEQMLECHTEVCMAPPSFIYEHLQTLSTRRMEKEVVFESVSQEGEASRIIRSYCVRLSPSEIRVAACGPHLWIRMVRRSRLPLDLLLPMPVSATGSFKTQLAISASN